MTSTDASDYTRAVLVGTAAELAGLQSGFNFFPGGTDYIPPEGQLLVERDTGTHRVGDGEHRPADLPAVPTPGAGGALPAGFGAGAGDNSLHMGGTNPASAGTNSFIGGSSAEAAGEGSFAFGISVRANGESSAVVGNGATADGDYSWAEAQAHTEGPWSHGEGGGHTTVDGEYSHAEGDQTTASASTAHAEGNGTTASGPHSHAEGNATTASGTSAHAQGASTTATGDWSHAAGNNSHASAEGAHASGLLAHASRQYEYSHSAGQINATAQGQFSRLMAACHAFGDSNNLSTGDGTSDIPLTDNCLSSISLTVSALSADGTAAATLTATALVDRTAGTARIAGFTTDTINADTDGAAWNLTAATSATGIGFSVNLGAGAQTEALCYAVAEIVELAHPT